MRQRMGVVVVGPSGSGKTCLWKVLMAALAKIGQTVIKYTMNPKAMPRTQVCENFCFVFVLLSMTETNSNLLKTGYERHRVCKICCNCETCFQRNHNQPVQRRF